jgi:hypothetical protein
MGMALSKAERGSRRSATIFAGIAAGPFNNWISGFYKKLA